MPLGSLGEGPDDPDDLTEPGPEYPVSIVLLAQAGLPGPTEAMIRHKAGGPSPLRLSAPMLAPPR
jgi:hypothetical protein